MKKENLYLTLTTFVMATLIILTSDRLTYLTVSLMALAVTGIIWSNRKSLTKITRWSKANPEKTWGLIAAIQLVLTGLGVLMGYNLKKLGYEFSDTSIWVFCILMVFGFLQIPFWPKKNVFIIPKQLNRQRFACLTITLSYLVLIVISGNRIADIYPDAPLTHVLEKIDQVIFQENNNQTVNHDKVIGHNHQEKVDGELSARAILVVKNGGETIVPPNFSKNISPGSKLKKAAKAKRKAEKKLRKKLRRAFNTGVAVGAAFLIVLLVLTFCGGVCLAGFGIAGAISSNTSLALVGIVLGPLIAVGSILGIIEVIDWKRRNQNN